MRMIQQIEHRGPDSDAYWLDADVTIALGHRRLAILDSSPAGAQPMRAVSGRFVMAFMVPPQNSLALADGLQQAMQAWSYSAGLWQARQQPARERIAQHFSIEQMSAAYAAIWEA